MLHIDFLAILNENLGVYCCCFFVCSILFFFIGRRLTHSWIDPLRITLVFSAFAAAVPPFLYFVGLIKMEILLNFIISESLFWVGFLCLSFSNISFSRTRIIGEGRIAFALYIFMFIVYAFLMLFTYVVLGVPLFMDSRLSLFADTGLGTIERLLPLLQTYCLIYSFHLLGKERYFRKRILPYVVFSVFVVTGILSGSKSALLPFLYSYFGYSYFFKETLDIGRRYLKFFFLAAGAGVIVVAFSLNVSVLEAIGVFLFRFIAAGDIYWMGYVDDVYRKVIISDSFTYLFSGILAPMRIIPAPEISSGIGFQMVGIINPQMENILVGPNPRAPFLGFVLFGWWGILFNLFVGMFLSIMIYRLPKVMPKGIVTCAYYTYVYTTLMNFVIDPAYSVGLIMNIVVCTVFLAIAVIFFMSLESSNCSSE